MTSLYWYTRRAR